MWSPILNLRIVANYAVWLAAGADHQWIGLVATCGHVGSVSGCAPFQSEDDGGTLESTALAEQRSQADRHLP